MQQLEVEIDRLCRETGFSGVVRVQLDGELAFERACGDADRRWGIPNTLRTKFGIASGTKSLTALTVMSLAESGVLDVCATARSLLGEDLLLIDNQVTVGHLLAHRSGIGDYLDESQVGDVNDYVLGVPVQKLATTEDYLSVLEGHPTVFPPGQRFAYNNGGYVVLALLAERAAGVPFHQLVIDRVCRPAGMHDTAFLRSDTLPGGTALGYLDGSDRLQTNVMHLPVRGSGDGGLYTTVADISALWAALFKGLILPPERVADMIHPHSDAPAERMRYGLGFWLDPTSDAVVLEGADAGVSFRSVHRPSSGATSIVVSNTSGGAWPVARALAALLDAS